ncbi:MULTISPECIES: hypothetical protein [Moorena]|uniref:Uncharacterized protein n=1 Tax=Moorena producens 3L TaxID=489825 RepID=F4XVT2_9CYAN|nr:MULTISPECIES: hypothetical protein [Moorena]EGJ31345.1 hypothetical protein LYNGBM3L_40950 [Moorena producens 3L]NEP34516.1 hypothetical protein [Moorena sp. SIO3B2]NEP70101.1 hypothetical protein [Moorena sp. SIO3A5]OLT66978.1 hypothetical protein BI334_19960 [Moorena producens 3L]
MSYTGALDPLRIKFAWCISLKLFDPVVRYGQQPNPGYEAENEEPPNAPGCISLKLFDPVVRYGQQPNPGYEAENEEPPNAPYAKFCIIAVARAVRTSTLVSHPK